MSDTEENATLDPSDELPTALHPVNLKLDYDYSTRKLCWII